MPQSIYLEDHSLSLTDLIKIARSNLKYMIPDWKRLVIDRILEIIEERLNEEIDSGSHVNDGHADKS